MGSVSPGILRTSLASLKVAGYLAASIGPRGGCGLGLLGRLKGVLWAMGNVFLRPLGPLIQLPGLWALAWSPGDAVQSGLDGSL